MNNTHAFVLLAVVSISRHITYRVFLRMVNMKNGLIILLAQDVYSCLHGLDWYCERAKSLQD